MLCPEVDYPHHRKGGVLHEDLAYASLEALKTPRSEARSQALLFSWDESTRLFEQHLVPIQRVARKPTEVYP